MKLTPAAVDFRRNSDDNVVHQSVDGIAIEQDQTWRTAVHDTDRGRRRDRQDRRGRCLKRFNAFSYLYNNNNISFRLCLVLSHLVTNWIYNCLDFAKKIQLKLGCHIQFQKCFSLGCKITSIIISTFLAPFLASITFLTSYHRKRVWQRVFELENFQENFSKKPVLINQ